MILQTYSDVVIGVTLTAIDFVDLGVINLYMPILNYSKRLEGYYAEFIYLCYYLETKIINL